MGLTVDYQYPRLVVDYLTLFTAVKQLKDNAKKHPLSAVCAQSDYFERMADENRRADFNFNPRNAD